MTGRRKTTAHWNLASPKKPLHVSVMLKKPRIAPMSESDAHDELLAYFIEEAVENGLDPTAIKNGGPLYQWFRTLWAAAKVALRKIGLNRFDDITAQNIVDLAYGAAKLEITGTWHGTAADFRNFNHDYMGSGEGAQAYGWGTYLAQRPGIAKEYWVQMCGVSHAERPGLCHGKP